MKVVELLELRRQKWSELERLCQQMERSTKRSIGHESVMRFAHLYRSACADLALADAYQLPADTIAYLHQLVGRAHNQLYRSGKFKIRAWFNDMIFVLPPRLFRDNSLRLAFVLFWGIFIAAMALAYVNPQFTEELAGREYITNLESMYSQPMQGRDPTASGAMTGYYQWHNTSIGLRCFAAGLILGVGGLFELVFNAGVIGAAFGHMAQAPQRANFFEFVTAHGPFELTAIVLSAAAGMRLGFSLVATRGLRRIDSLALAARKSLPVMMAAVTLFVLAALIEGFISPTSLPY